MAKGSPCEGKKTIEEPQGKGKSETNSNFWPEIFSGVESSMNREIEKEKIMKSGKEEKGLKKQGRGLQWIPFRPWG